GVVINAKRGKYLYVRNGPIINWKDKKLIEAVINHLKDYCKKQNLWFLRISPLIDLESSEEKVLSSFGFPKSVMNDVEALDTWVMDIAGTEEEVFNRISKKTKYEIRKAEKSGLEVLITQDSKYIDDFHEILRDTIERQKWTAYSKE